MTEYSFDFKQSQPESEIIAHIVSGKNKGKLIYLNNEKAKQQDDKVELLLNFIDDNRYKISKKKLDILISNLLNEEEPIDKELNYIYKSFLDSLKQPKEIILEGSQLEVVPFQGDSENVQRDVIFISACSGAGKTTWISNYCKYFNKLYPSSPIYLLSCKPLEDEPAYKHIKRIKQIEMSEPNLQEILNEGPAYQQFISRTGQSLLICDDFDGVDKKIEKLVQVIINNVLQLGRSKRIFTIISKHQLNTGQPTKIIWSEANKIVLFPNGLSRYALTYAMTHYLGFDKKMIDKVLNNKSRWILIHNHLPKYYITQNSLSLL